MQSQRVDVEGMPLAALVGVGPGPTVVLVHGGSGSTRTFHRQLGGALAGRHRLVAVDFPGHGDSPWAEVPEQVYTVPGYARVLAGIAERLDLRGAVWAGWSLGGHIILEAAGALPEPAGFLICGTPPLRCPMAPDAFLPNPTLAVAFRADSNEEEVESFLSAWVRPGSPVPDVFRDDFRRTDPAARATLGASLGPGGYRDEVEIVAGLDIPLAVVQGGHDQLVNRAYLDRLAMPTLWRGAIQDIDEAGHAPQVETPAEFDAVLEAFVDDCQARAR